MCVQFHVKLNETGCFVFNFFGSKWNWLWFHDFKEFKLWNRKWNFFIFFPDRIWRFHNFSRLKSWNHSQFHFEPRNRKKNHLYFYFYCATVSRENFMKLAAFFLINLASKMKLADDFIILRAIKLWNRQKLVGKKMKLTARGASFFSRPTTGGFIISWPLK